MSVGNGVSANSTPDTVMNGAGEAEFFIENLVDPQLRAAFEKQEGEREGDDHAQPIQPSVSNKAPVSADPSTPQKEDEEDETYRVAEPEEDAVSDDELDLSEESIEALLNGDPSKVKVKKTTSEETEEEDDAPWKKEAEYTELAQRLGFNGATPEALDKLIKKVADSAVINNSAITNSIREKNKTLEKHNTEFALEIKRLKTIEQNAYFETSEETKNQFDMPMSAAAEEISKVLKIEGADVSVKKLLEAPNRSELNKLLANEVLDDDATFKITNQWKIHTQLKGEREAAREEARRNLQAGLSTKVDDKKASKIYQHSLGDILEDRTATQYNYIREAIESGDYENPKHQAAKTTLLQSQRDHKSMLQALANPLDHVNNSDWMRRFTKFIISSAHARNEVGRIPVLEETLAKNKTLLHKLTQEVLRLRGSAKGLTGVRGGDLSNIPKRNGASKSEDANALKQFKDFNAGKLDIEDLLGLNPGE